MGLGYYRGLNLVWEWENETFLHLRQIYNKWLIPFLSIELTLFEMAN